ncbi:hypothetical protein GCM10009678_22150 [Actinomadura kijaniata]
MQVARIGLALSERRAEGTRRRTVAAATIPHGAGSLVIGAAWDGGAGGRLVVGAGRLGAGPLGAGPLGAGSVSGGAVADGRPGAAVGLSPRDPSQNTAPAASTNDTTATSSATSRGRRAGDGGSGAE